MKSGMDRMLMYHDSILKDKQMRAACERCENFSGDSHDYHECNKCPVFEMYCELQEYRFAETFGPGDI
jgi:hypothetical protein